MIQQLIRKVGMDPQRKSFQLCELASCTDLPVFDDVGQQLFLPAKPPSSGDDDYESLETGSNCSYDSRFIFSIWISCNAFSPKHI